MYRICLLALIVCVAGFSGQAHERPGIEASVYVPNEGWKLKIVEVYQHKGKLLVVSELKAEGGATGLRRVKDKLEGDFPTLPAKHFVINDTWGWYVHDPVTRIRDRKDLEPKLEKAKLLYKRKELTAETK